MPRAFLTAVLLIDEQVEPWRCFVAVLLAGRSAFLEWLVCFVFADDVPDLPGPAQEHDIPVRARHVPDVWRPHRRLPHLPQAGREAHPALLNRPHPPHSLTSCVTVELHKVTNCYNITKKSATPELNSLRCSISGSWQLALFIDNV